ncbi:MAG: dicarboxylate/amino acid:cation symporter [Flavobacteriales bacterium]|nr:dicarboxylate/amino acid:cation symporter [Flavobacteriales bacterium]
MTNKKKKGLALHWKIIIGLIVGVIWAYICISINYDEKTGEGVQAVQFTKDWVAPFGTIFIRMLKFIAIPLVLFSIIIGVGSLKDISRLGRMGLKTLLTYLFTTVMAVSVGLILVNMFQPGKAIAEEERIKNRISYELWVESEPDIDFREGDDLRAAEDPKNAAIVAQLMEAPVDGEKSELQKFREILGKEEAEGSMGKLVDILTAMEADSESGNSKLDKATTAMKDKQSGGPLEALVDMVPDNIIVSLGNPKLMLQVIFFAIFFGVTMIMVPEEKSAPVTKVFDGINEVFLKMVDVIMKAAPFFVFALMAGTLCNMAGSITALNDILLSQGQYALVVVGGLLFMILLYPLLVSIFVKRFGYIEFWKKISPAQLLAFSTSSSAATLPVTMECVEDGVGVKPQVASFVLPIGATVNMDGTSLYQAVAVVFLAQLHMIDLTLGEQAIIVMTATLGSIGAAAVPSGGIVMLMIVLSSVGLNPAWIAIILPVDRILDMCRTVVNVTGDASVATVIAASEGEIKDIKA